MPSPEYRKNEDPFRIDAALIDAKIRDLFERGNQIEGAEVGEFELVKQGAVIPGDGVRYGAQRVICKRPALKQKAYSVHTAVLRADAAGVRGLYLIDGEYDLNLTEARGRL